jgi:lysozyme
MKTSAAGQQLIKKFEGCELTAYRDVVNVLTIGYGCTGPNIREGMTITQAEADQMLSDRLAQEFEPAVNKAIGSTPTTQPQFDAMVSLAFNIGAGGFLSSSVARDHAAGRYAAAADAFLLWNHAGGRALPALTRRRSEERALYLSAVDTVTVTPDAVEVVVRALQSALGVAIDGDPGPLTLAALAKWRAGR